MKLFSYARLMPDQLDALRPFIKNKVIHDLGAGPLGFSHTLIQLSAKHVVAVDSCYKSPSENHLNNCNKWKSGSPKISLRAETFEEFARSNKRVLRTVVVSWPMNTRATNAGDIYLSVLVALAHTVIYIGTNFDGSACGGPMLFRELRRREVRLHAPAPLNSLIVYGKVLNEPRGLLPEEQAQLSDDIVYYDDVFSSRQATG